jgi:hypothetical protein
MNKIALFLQRIPVLVKTFFLFLFLWGVFLYGVYQLLEIISQYLWVNYKLTIPAMKLAQAADLNFVLFFLGLVCLIVGLWSLDVFQFANRIQKILKESLADRQLSESLPHFFERGSFYASTKNLVSLLQLYRSFDRMKSGRIALEMNTIKTLINHTRQAVLLINQEKVVTHINHTGEQLLKLIPGEIIGQAVSRKISHKLFLSSLDEALEFDKKVIEVEIDFKDAPFSMDVLPLKDKFGEIVRALVILDTHPETVENSEDTK